MIYRAMILSLATAFLTLMVGAEAQAATSTAAMQVSLVITSSCTTQSTAPSNSHGLQISENCEQDTPVALESNQKNLNSSVQLRPNSYIIDSETQNNDNNIVTVIY